jgi:SagB-type dehydrogenase family enzyme
MTRNRHHEIALRYVQEQVFGRWAPATEIAEEHGVNWADQPFRFKLYRDAYRIPLRGSCEINRLFANRCSPEPDPLTHLPLSALLYLLGAPLRRKASINWNQDFMQSVQHTHQSFGRATGSGGGLYPVEFYLAVCSEAYLPAGIYHYSGAHHSLVPLQWGDQQEQMSEALLEVPGTEQFSMYVLLSIDFWKNCFKYRNFGFHVCTQDVGAALATSTIVCNALGILHEVFLCFDDRKLNGLVGLDTVGESIFAVVGIGPKKQSYRSQRPIGQCDYLHIQSPWQVTWQRSAHVAIPEGLRTVHMASLVETEDGEWLRPQFRPCKPTLEYGHERDQRARQVADLSSQIRGTLPSILMARHSAWGSMRALPLLPLEWLISVLQYISSTTSTISLNMRELVPENAVQLLVVANHVAGISQGVYRWNAADASLKSTAVTSTFVNWQSAYGMDNYNLEQASCLLLITGNLRLMLELFGNRGYRLLNHQIGVIAQLAYVAATAGNIRCGAVLGVREQMLKEILGLDAKEDIFLAVLLGRGERDLQIFDHRFLPDVPRWD